MHSISEGFFEAMGATFAAGRSFTAFDGADAPGVIMVNEMFANRYLPDGALGRVVRNWSSAIGPLGASLKAVRNSAPAVFRSRLSASSAT